MKKLYLLPIVFFTLLSCEKESQPPVLIPSTPNEDTTAINQEIP